MTNTTITTDTKTKATEFFLKILIKLWHAGTAERIKSDLNSNRGFGNGTEDHINNCSICQKKLAGIDRKNRPRL
jgi:hypothetical protein